MWTLTYSRKYPEAKAEYWEGNLIPCGPCKDVYLCCYVLNACRNEPQISELPPREAGLEK